MRLTQAPGAEGMRIERKDDVTFHGQEALPGKRGIISYKTLPFMSSPALSLF